MTVVRFTQVPVERDVLFLLVTVPDGNGVTVIVICPDAELLAAQEGCGRLYMPTLLQTIVPKSMHSVSYQKLA